MLAPWSRACQFTPAMGLQGLSVRGIWHHRNLHQRFSAHVPARLTVPTKMTEPCLVCSNTTRRRFGRARVCRWQFADLLHLHRLCAEVPDQLSRMSVKTTRQIMTCALLAYLLMQPFFGMLSDPALAAFRPCCGSVVSAHCAPCRFF